MSVTDEELGDTRDDADAVDTADLPPAIAA